MLDRTKAPKFSKKFSLDFPHPDVITITDDLKLIHHYGIQQDVFKLEFIFKSGKWHEPKPGLAHFTSSMLEKGTLSKSALQIAETIDYFGAQLDISPGLDYTSVSIYSINKNFTEVFPLMAEILQTPSFAEDELLLLKQIFIQNLKVNNEKTSYIASRQMRKNIFGESHPYGSSVEEPDVSAIERADMIRYFNGHFSPHEIYLTGNIHPDQLNELSSSAHKMITDASNEPSFHPVPGNPYEDKIAKVGRVQSSIRMGKRTIGRNHPDYFPMLLLNHIFGGYFGSRLMKNIREEKGLTYGIYSSLSPFKHECLYSIGAEVNQENLPITIQEIKNEMSQLQNILIGEQELQVAKNHFLGSLQLEVANPFAVLEKVKNIRLHHLPEDYYQKLSQSILELNSQMLLDMAQIYFDPKDLFTVVVG